MVVDSPACRGDGTAATIADDGGGVVMAADVADFAFELDQMNGFVAEGVVVDHKADFSGEFV